MASIRQLPSGNFQATVLWSRQRITRTFPTKAKAQLWAKEQEKEKAYAMGREEEEQYSPAAVLLISQLARLAAKGRLGRDHGSRLREIADVIDQVG